MDPDHQQLQNPWTQFVWFCSGQVHLGPMRISLPFLFFLYITDPYKGFKNRICWTSGHLLTTDRTTQQFWVHGRQAVCSMVVLESPERTLSSETKPKWTRLQHLFIFKPTRSSSVPESKSVESDTSLPELGPEPQRLIQFFDPLTSSLMFYQFY